MFRYIVHLAAGELVLGDDHAEMYIFIYIHIYILTYIHILYIYTYICICIHIYVTWRPSSGYLRALLSVCGGYSFGGFGCSVCVGVGGVVLCWCVCVCV